MIGNARVHPSYALAVRRQIAKAGLAANVKFAGVVPDRELSEHMKVSHVLAMPPSFEGYGVVYAEAMGFGLPAVGTTSGAAREIITHGRNGLLISSGDVLALTSYRSKLTQNRQCLLEMSFAARKHYQSLPTWEGSMYAIRTFLSELADNAPF